MWRMILRRGLTAVPLLVAVSFGVFLIIDLTPGDPAELLAGEDPTPEKIAHVRQSLGLDEPLLHRYWDWLSGALRGDLGRSLTTGESVGALIAQKVGVTASLALVTIIFTLVIGGFFGILGALRNRGFADRATTFFGSISIAIPPSWLGLVLIVFLAVSNRVFPALGYVPLANGFGDWLFHLILPALVLSTLPAGELTMQLKSSLQEALGQDYIVTARAKGLLRRSVVFKHALRNAAIPVVTVLGFRIAQLVGETTIVEAVFNLNGLGTLALHATLARDVPVLLGVVMFAVLVVVVVNMIVDTSYGLLNPKVRR